MENCRKTCAENWNAPEIHVDSMFMDNEKEGSTLAREGLQMLF